MADPAIKAKIDEIVYCTVDWCPNSVTFKEDEALKWLYPVFYIYFTIDYLWRITVALSRNAFIDLRIDITNAQAEIIIILTPILSLGGLTFATFGGAAAILGIIGITTVSAVGISGGIVVAQLSSIVIENENVYALFFNGLWAIL